MHNEVGQFQEFMHARENRRKASLLVAWEQRGHMAAEPVAKLPLRMCVLICGGWQKMLLKALSCVCVCAHSQCSWMIYLTARLL